MITYYFKDSHEQDLATLSEVKPGAWVNVEHPTLEEIDTLVEKFKLDAGHVSDALDIDEIPRLEVEDDRIYVFLRYAYAADNLDLSTALLLIILNPENIITIAMQGMPRLQQFTSGNLLLATSQQIKLFLEILNQVIDQYGVYISNISRRIRGIRTRLKTHDVVNQDFIDFVTIEDDLNDFLSGLEPMSAILQRVLDDPIFKLHKADQELIEDLILSTNQLIGASKSHIRGVASIRDAHATISSNNLNRSMKVLTAATMLIALPNLFYGMYGMNVPLPYQHSPWAYAAIVSLTFIVIIVIYVLGRAKKIF